DSGLFFCASHLWNSASDALSGTATGRPSGPTRYRMSPKYSRGMVSDRSDAGDFGPGALTSGADVSPVVGDLGSPPTGPWARHGIPANRSPASNSPHGGGESPRANRIGRGAHCITNNHNLLAHRAIAIVAGNRLKRSRHIICAARDSISRSLPVGAG